jgi:hypothetical protein
VAGTVQSAVHPERGNQEDIGRVQVKQSNLASGRSQMPGSERNPTLLRIRGLPDPVECQKRNQASWLPGDQYADLLLKYGYTRCRTGWYNPSLGDLEPAPEERSRSIYSFWKDRINRS